MMLVRAPTIPPHISWLISPPQDYATVPSPTFHIPLPDCAGAVKVRLLGLTVACFKPMLLKEARATFAGGSKHVSKILERYVVMGLLPEHIYRPNDPIPGADFQLLCMIKDRPRWLTALRFEGRTLALLVGADAVRDAIAADGIDPGGHLRGEWLWLQHSSQLRLTRVGSSVYRSVVVPQPLRSTGVQLAMRGMKA